MDDLQRYRVYLTEEKQASQNTIASYLRDVTQFAEQMPGQGGCLREATADLVRDYMNWMLSRGKSTASATRSLAAVKSFYNFLMAAGEDRKSVV